MGAAFCGTRLATIMRERGLNWELPDADVILRLQRLLRQADEERGPLEEITKAGVVSRFFNGCGEWMGNERVPFSKITRMIFGDRYRTTHEKYLETE
jgi:hypothetical protein